MALTKCNECGAEISSKAMACPKCGYPAGFKRTMKRAILLQVIVLLVVFAFMFVLFSSAGIIG